MIESENNSRDLQEEKEGRSRRSLKEIFLGCIILNGMRLFDGGEECYVEKKKFNSSACKIFSLFLVVYFANSFVTFSH